MKKTITTGTTVVLFGEDEMLNITVEKHLDKSAGIWLIERMLIYVANYNFR